MGFNAKLVVMGAVSGNLDTIVAGTRTGVGSVSIAQVEPGTLAADCTVDAETNTLTMYAEWQVSTDGSTWALCMNGPQNAATVVLATGTAGADAAVQRVIEPPAAVYAFPYARLCIRNEVQTGAAVDTYSVVYRFQRRRFGG